MARPADSSRVLVIGIGNILMGDEGAGVHALRRLAEQPMTTGVSLLDGGTAGVDLLAEFDGRAVIMIDATRDGSGAGTLGYHYRRHGWTGGLPQGLGAHDFGLRDLLAAAALLGKLREFHLYTIAVETVRPMCLDLSSEVALALPAIVQAVRLQAGRLARAGFGGGPQPQPKISQAPAMATAAPAARGTRAGERRARVPSRTPAPKRSAVAAAKPAL